MIFFLLLVCQLHQYWIHLVDSSPPFSQHDSEKFLVFVDGNSSLKYSAYCFQQSPLNDLWRLWAKFQDGTDGESLEVFFLVKNLDLRSALVICQGTDVEETSH